MNLSLPPSSSTDVSPATRKTVIEQRLAAGEFVQAAEELRLLWRVGASLANAAWIKRAVARFEQSFFRQIVKVAFLRSATIEPMVTFLEAAAAGERVRMVPYVGGFGTYAQELLDPSAGLASFEPDLSILCVDTRSIAPDLWAPTQMQAERDHDSIVERVQAELRRLIDAFHGGVSGTLLIHSLELPPTSHLGIADFSDPGGQFEAIRRINRWLVEVAATEPGVMVLDLESLLRQLGTDQWFDDERWESMRLPWTAKGMLSIADRWFRFVYALKSPPRKVLVVDLDDTLWSGILGEEGDDGIALGPDGRGRPHRALQQALLSLSRRGVLLAICSKNDHALAWNTIQAHPEMLLRPTDFAGVRINWKDKPTNLIDLATELDLGIESFAFLDDNVREREHVRRVLPEVRVIDFETPEAMAGAVLSEVGFERVRIGDNDRSRVDSYVNRRLRSELKSTKGNLNDYLHSLETRLVLVSNQPHVMERVAQLSQRTNQFNLTGVRRSAREIEDLSKTDDWDVLAFQVMDRFGDEGIVGALILHQINQTVEIDSFLLSCRVLGRGVESGMLHGVGSILVRRGGGVLIGRYLPTDKNSRCAGCYSDHGFCLGSVEGTWRMEITSNNPLELPAWLTLKTGSHELIEQQRNE